MKKYVKTIVACAILIATTAAFFGAPTSIVCKIQPGVTLWFLVVLLLTPIVGRLFCEVCCPLGTIQWIVNKLFRRKTAVRRICTRLPETNVQLYVRWSIFAASMLLAATGCGALGWLLTPYSIYGKALSFFIPGVVIFAVVVVLAAIGNGRIWCNWICPAGTLFNILSKKSAFRHRTNKSCRNCRACFPESPDKLDKIQSSSAAITRRDAIKGVVAVAAVESVEKTTDGGFAPVSLHGAPERSTPVLPPGSIDRMYFNAKCVACGLCISSCRGNCLKASTSLKRFGQPEMDFRQGYCLLKCNHACGRVCPTGAIGDISSIPRKNVHAGVAVWQKDVCIRTTENVSCTACIKKCPVGAIHLVKGIPVVDKYACIGCGACEHVCPARPLPAIVVNGYERQKILRPMDEDNLIAEMKMLVKKGMSCVAAKDGVIIARETGRGIEPALKLLSEGKLDGALVVDKVVGRAAAAIFIVGKARKLHASIMSAEAATLLKENRIGATADKIVPVILNRDMTDGCPMEYTVNKLDDPAEMVKALKAKVESPK